MHLSTQNEQSREMKFYRGDPCQKPELDEAGVFLALNPKVAGIYGYVRVVETHGSKGLKHFTSDDMLAYQELWKQYCEENSAVNSKAFPAAFMVLNGIVVRNSEFILDTIVMKFFKATFGQQYDAIQFPELPTLVDRQPHHEELFWFDRASLTLSSEIVDFDYDHLHLKEMCIKKQKAISSQDTKKRKQCRPSKPEAIEVTEATPKKKLAF
jgi:hypothetical protein